MINYAHNRHNRNRSRREYQTDEEREKTDPAVKELNLTRAQLIDYCLDMMYHGDEEEQIEAKEKLYVICPNREVK